MDFLKSPTLPTVRLRGEHGDKKRGRSSPCSLDGEVIGYCVSSSRLSAAISAWLVNRFQSEQRS